VFARSVSLHLKRNSAGEFITLFQSEAIPFLRLQAGFQDALTLVTPDGKDTVVISLWANKALAEAYQLNGYPELLRKLAPVMEGRPQVTTYEVGNSTLSLDAVGALIGGQN
jgi:hypothetical protein